MADNNNKILYYIYITSKNIILENKALTAIFIFGYNFKNCYKNDW